MPAAPVGGDDPLAALQPLELTNADVTAGEGLCGSDLKYVRYGPDPSILPYTIQNDYGELREPREFRVAVLENAHLRATFLLNCCAAIPCFSREIWPCVGHGSAGGWSGMGL